MAGIPQNFQSISPVIANYDFVDIASGTGYITFYPGLSLNNTIYTTVNDIVLSNFKFYTTGPNPYIGGTLSSSATKSVVADYDFDVVLNRPMDISGKAFVNLPVYTNQSSGSTDGDVYFVVAVSKWDGSTETQIASSEIQLYPVVIDGYRMLCTSFTLPLTHFKRGETLRLTLRVLLSRSSGTTSGRIGVDPMNRTSGWDATGAVPSSTVFYCPVRLNL